MTAHQSHSIQDVPYLQLTPIAICIEISKPQHIQYLPVRPLCRLNHCCATSYPTTCWDLDFRIMQHPWPVLCFIATVSAILLAGAAICLSSKRKMSTFTIPPQGRQMMRHVLLCVLPPGEVCQHYFICCSTATLQWFS